MKTTTQKMPVFVIFSLFMTGAAYAGSTSVKSEQAINCGMIDSTNSLECHFDYIKPSGELEKGPQAFGDLDYNSPTDEINKSECQAKVKIDTLVGNYEVVFNNGGNKGDYINVLSLSADKKELLIKAAPVSKYNSRLGMFEEWDFNIQTPDAKIVQALKVKCGMNFTD